jgi:hypothetical protein
MDSAKIVAVSRRESEYAFEFVNFGAPGEHTASISVATGKIYWHSMLSDLEEEDDPDEDDDAEGYISVPHKNDLGLGSRLVLRFAGEEMPSDYDTVADFFRRRGAYRRFKELLQRRRKLEQWYDFEERAEAAALLEWCEANDIQLVDDPPAAAPE